MSETLIMCLGEKQGITVGMDTDDKFVFISPWVLSGDKKVTPHLALSPDSARELASRLVDACDVVEEKSKEGAVTGFAQVSRTASPA